MTITRPTIDSAHVQPAGAGGGRWSASTVCQPTMIQATAYSSGIEHCEEPVEHAFPRRQAARRGGRWSATIAAGQVVVGARRRAALSAGPQTSPWGNEVDAARVPGVAAAEPADGQPAAAHEPVPVDRLEAYAEQDG